MTNTARKTSVPAPLLSALNSTPIYYDPRLPWQQYEVTIGVPISALRRCSHASIAALHVIALYGMRASEYLSATVSQIMTRDRLWIRGLKGSRSYVIYLPGIYEQMAPFVLTCPGRLVAGITYARLYRSCVRAGVGTLLARHRNASRTHLFRHRLASEVNGVGVQAVTDALRHRSSSTARYYVP